MKLRHVDISSDFFETLMNDYNIFICLTTEYDNSKFDYFSCIDDYAEYLILIEFFGNVEISSLKFSCDTIYINFNLDNDLFLEFKKFFEKKGVYYA
jgi:hypothetical protein